MEEHHKKGNVVVKIFENDISSPEMVSGKAEGEFKSPDTILETTIVDKKTVNT